MNSSMKQINGDGFAFFAWRVTSHPHIGDDASWWAFWRNWDFVSWRYLVEGKCV